jgi:hypothetical protein
VERRAGASPDLMLALLLAARPSAERAAHGWAIRGFDRAGKPPPARLRRQHRRVAECRPAYPAPRHAPARGQRWAFRLAGYRDMAPANRAVWPALAPSPASSVTQGRHEVSVVAHFEIWPRGP